MKANTHIVIKREDVLKYLTDNQIKYLDAVLTTIAGGRKKDGKKPNNSYYICNTDEPYADEVLEVILKAEGDIEKRKEWPHKPCINYEDGCEEWTGCPCVHYKAESEDKQ